MKTISSKCNNESKCLKKKAQGQQISHENVNVNKDASLNCKCIRIIDDDDKVNDDMEHHMDDDNLE